MGAAFNVRPVPIMRRLPADARWRDRLLLAERLRLLTPAGPAVRLARRRAARSWERDPGLRRIARDRLRAIVAGTHREPELEALARASVLEDAAVAELFLRPAILVGRRRVGGLGYLTRAVASGRGVVVSYCHLGPFTGCTATAAMAGPATWVIGGAWIASPPQPGATGRLLERWRGYVGRTGARVMLAHHGVLEDCTALLRGGEVVSVLFDMPGSMRTPWLGKPVALAGGTARMAHAGDALVVPLHSRRVGGRAHSTFLAPLDPRDFASPDALHLALAARHERLILQQPEALESPLRPGSWQTGAGPQAWAHPRG